MPETNGNVPILALSPEFIARIEAVSGGLSAADWLNRRLHSMVGKHEALAKRGYNIQPLTVFMTKERYERLRGNFPISFTKKKGKRLIQAVLRKHVVDIPDQEFIDEAHTSKWLEKPETPASTEGAVTITKGPLSSVPELPPETAAPFEPHPLSDVDELFHRIWNQVENGLDEVRLMPAADKQSKELVKKLDRPIEKNGWRMFVSGQVYGMANGKAPKKRSCERMLVEQISKWRTDVLRFAPHRLDDLKRIVQAGLASPEAPAREPN